MAITINSIDLEWSAATDNIAVTRYEVEKSTDGITFDAGINVGNVTSYTYGSLSADTPYWFRISAFDAASNESNYSNIVTASTLEAAYLLDSYTGAAAAYSLRKLRSGELYSVQVRRSSDDATTDVLLDSSSSLSLSSTVSAGGTLSTWVGSNSAYVRTWYDQSGNSLDKIQTVNASQPRIVNAGSLEVLNSKAAINSHTAGVTFLAAPTTLSGTGDNLVCTNFYVGATTNLSSSSYQTSILPNTYAADRRTYAKSFESPLVIRMAGGAQTYNLGASSGVQLLWSTGHLSTASDSFGRKNGTVMTLDGGLDTLNMQADSAFCNFKSGSYTTSTGSAAIGFAQEDIWWLSDNWSDAAAIESDINTHYSIYP